MSALYVQQQDCTFCIHAALTYSSFGMFWFFPKIGFQLLFLILILQICQSTQCYISFPIFIWCSCRDFEKIFMFNLPSTTCQSAVWTNEKGSCFNTHTETCAFSFSKKILQGITGSSCSHSNRDESYGSTKWI